MGFIWWCGDRLYPLAEGLFPEKPIDGARREAHAGKRPPSTEERVVAEEKSWHQRSMEDAAQRRADHDYGHRTGVAFNDASQKGAQLREEGRRNREALERMAQKSLQAALDDTWREGKAPTLGLPAGRTTDRIVGSEYAEGTIFDVHRALIRDAKNLLPDWLGGLCLLLAYFAGLAGALNSGESVVNSLVAGVAAAVVAIVVAWLLVWPVAIAFVIVRATWKPALVLGAFWLAGWLHQNGYF
jgi:hypothetical protein